MMRLGVGAWLVARLLVGARGQSNVQSRYEMISSVCPFAEGEVPVDVPRFSDWQVYFCSCFLFTNCHFVHLSCTIFSDVHSD